MNRVSFLTRAIALFGLLLPMLLAQGEELRSGSPETSGLCPMTIIQANNMDRELIMIQGVRWLLGQQQSDGGWPYARVANTSLAVLVLISRPEFWPFEDQREKGVEFLIKNTENPETLSMDELSLAIIALASEALSRNSEQIRTQVANLVSVLLEKGRMNVSNLEQADYIPSIDDYRVLCLNAEYAAWRSGVKTDTIADNVCHMVRSFREVLLSNRNAQMKSGDYLWLPMSMIPASIILNDTNLFATVTNTFHITPISWKTNDCQSPLLNWCAISHWARNQRVYNQRLAKVFFASENAIWNNRVITSGRDNDPVERIIGVCYWDSPSESEFHFGSFPRDLPCGRFHNGLAIDGTTSLNERIQDTCYVLLQYEGISRLYPQYFDDWSHILQRFQESEESEDLMTTRQEFINEN